MLIDGFNHVAVLTSDTARLVAFYGEMFGATVDGQGVDEAELRLTILKIGRFAELNVFEIAGNDESSRQTPMFGRGRLDHLALQAASLPDFETIRERLVTAGASDGFVTDFGPILSLFFRDPDGLEAEVCVPNPDAIPASSTHRARRRGASTPSDPSGSPDLGLPRRPRTRSPTMFLFTSVVPPAMLSERGAEQAAGPRAVEGGHAKDVERRGGEGLLVLGPGQLDHAALGARRLAGEGGADRAAGQELEEAGVGVAGGQGLAGHQVIGGAAAVRTGGTSHHEQPVELATDVQVEVGHAGPLVAQGAGGDGPAAVDLAQQARRREQYGAAAGGVAAPRLGRIARSPWPARRRARCGPSGNPPACSARIRSSRRRVQSEHRRRGHDSQSHWSLLRPRARGPHLGLKCLGGSRMQNASFCTRSCRSRRRSSLFSLRQSMALTVPNSFGSLPARPNLPNRPVQSHLVDLAVDIDVVRRIGIRDVEELIRLLA